MINAKLGYIIFVVGIMVSYITFDFYAQNKTGKSVIQIMKLIAAHKTIDDVVTSDTNTSEVTYLLYINGVEHNFSFTNFSIRDLKFNGNVLDTVISSKRIKDNK